MTKTVVYTCVMGDYEQVNERDPRSLDSADAILFTDNPQTTSSTWDVVYVEPVLPADPVRSQRYVKILGHPVLDKYSQLLYVDNSVRVTAPVQSFVGDWLDGVSLAMYRHSFRESVLAEFHAVAQDKLDSAERLDEQLTHYLDFYKPVIEKPAHWSGMFARRNDAEYRAFARIWMDHVLRYSRRDQLSVRVAQHISEIRYREIVGDNHQSATHEWPILNERRAELRTKTFVDYRSRSENLQAELDTLLSSQSWRLTRPLRWARRLFAKR